jgi:hypothetical protein
MNYAKKRTALLRVKIEKKSSHRGLYIFIVVYYYY